MSHHSYLQSREISSYDYQFSALIMAAMRKADSDNLVRLQAAFPDIWVEFQERYWAPGGLLEQDGIPRTEDPS